MTQIKLSKRSALAIVISIAWVLLAGSTTAWSCSTIIPAFMPGHGTERLAIEGRDLPSINWQSNRLNERWLVRHILEGIEVTDEDWVSLGDYARRDQQEVWLHAAWRRHFGTMQPTDSDLLAGARRLHQLDIPPTAYPRRPQAWKAWAHYVSAEHPVATLRRALKSRPDAYGLRLSLAAEWAAAGQRSKALDLLRRGPRPTSEDFTPWERQWIGVLTEDQWPSFHLARATGAWCWLLDIFKSARERVDSPALDILIEDRTGIATKRLLGSDLPLVFAQQLPIPFHLQLCKMDGDCLDDIERSNGPLEAILDELAPQLLHIGLDRELARIQARVAAQALAADDIDRAHEHLHTSRPGDPVLRWLAMLRADSSVDQRFVDPTDRATEPSQAPRWDTSDGARQPLDAKPNREPARLEACRLFPDHVEDLGQWLARHLTDSPRSFRDVDKILTTCAEAENEVPDPRRPAVVVDALRRVTDKQLLALNRPDELERRLRDPKADPILLLALISSLRRDRPRLTAALDRYLEARPEDLLARYHRLCLIDSAAELLVALENAVAQHPEHLDLRIWWATEALAADDLKTVRAQATHLLEPASGAEVNPRQRADAHYLLGRVARLDGDLEAASDHFEAFFQHYMQTSPTAAAEILKEDMAFSHHLIATGDWARLDKHMAMRGRLEAQTMALTRQLYPDANQRMVRLAASPVARTFSLVHPTLAIEGDVIGRQCRRPETVPYLEALAAGTAPGDPSSDAIAERLRQARAVACTTDRNDDIDALFLKADRRLLATARELLQP